MSSIEFNSSSPGDIFLSYTFHYRPQITSAWIAIGCFAVVTVLSTLLTVTYGGRFMYIVPAMGAVEAVGYGLRIMAAEDKNLVAFILSTLLILMAPIALALVNYIVVAKLLDVTSKSVVLLGRIEMKPKMISRIFFWSDFACFFIQGAGGGLLAMGDDTFTKVGTSVVLVGLVIQLVFFFGFIAILRKISTDDSFGLNQVHALSPVFMGLNLTVICLLVRNIFRVIEFASAPSGPAYTTEWAFSIFETLPIFLCIVLHCVYHFGRHLDSRNENPEWISEYNRVVQGKAFDANPERTAESTV